MTRVAMRSLRHAAVLAALVCALTISGALANSLSPNKSFNVPTPNSDTNTWGNLLDVDITDLDTLLGGTVAVPITSTVQTATTGQASNLVQKLTGALSGNTTYELPQSLGGFWIIDNETTGSFSLTVATSALSSTGVIIPQGVHELVESDGTNVYEVAPGGLPPTGSASGDLGGSYPAPTVTATHLASPLPAAQGGTGVSSLPLPLAEGGTGNATGQPSGTASGDLSGSYPNPTVAKIGGVTLSSSVGSIGYTTLPGGEIDEWGSVAFSGATSQAITFPLAFPSAVDTVQVTAISAGGTATTTGFVSQSKTGVTLTTGATYTGTVFWEAKGH